MGLLMKNSSNPLVSVVMPCYNHEPFVRDAVESIINQTYDNIEIVICDDGSSDNTVGVLKKYEEYYDWFQYFEGNTASRTYQIMGHATGKYIAIMNSDDVWEPEKLEKQVQYMEANPVCGACFSWVDYIDDENRIISGENPFCKSNQTSIEWMRFFFDNGNCLCHPSVLAKRDLYCDAVERSTVFRQLPDYYRWLYIIQKAEINIIPEALVHYRMHDEGGVQNTSANTNTNRVRTFLELSQIWYEIIDRMELGFFKDTFGSMFQKKGLLSDSEIMCEKFFLLLLDPRTYIQDAAFRYYYNNRANKEMMEAFLNSYGYTYAMFAQNQVELGYGRLLAGN